MAPLPPAEETPLDMSDIWNTCPVCRDKYVFYEGHVCWSRWHVVLGLLLLGLSAIGTAALVYGCWRWLVG